MMFKPQLNRLTLTSLLVAMVFFMENLDATVIGTSLPVMASSFHTAPQHLSVGVSAYLVALTVFIPLSGWAVERFGARRVFSSAIMLFTIASAFCAASNGLSSFTVARVLQGAGGAMMVPVGRLVVLRDTPKEKLVRAVATLTWPALIAPLLGPPVGGWISTHWSWHWIFLLNLPLGALALASSFFLIPQTSAHPKPLDVRGALYSGIGFCLFVSGIEAMSRNVRWSISLPMTLCGIALLAACARHLQRANNPLFALTPIKIRTFRITLAGGSLFRIAIGSAPFLLPLLFEVGFGYSAVHAGALLLWLFAGNLAMKPATTWIMKRFGFKKVLLTNGLLVILGFIACAYLKGNTALWIIEAILFANGLARSMQFTALNTIGFAEIAAEQMRDATTIFSLVQQMNAGLGIAVGALFLQIAKVVHNNHSTSLTTSDFRFAFLLNAVLAILACLDFWSLEENAGHQILRKK